MNSLLRIGLKRVGIKEFALWRNWVQHFIPDRRVKKSLSDQIIKNGHKTHLRQWFPLGLMMVMIQGKVWHLAAGKNNFQQFWPERLPSWSRRYGRHNHF
jgi:hypothetical protein